MSNSLENIPKQTAQPAANYHKKRKWVVLHLLSHIVGRALGLFVFIFLLLAFITQLPPAQRWAVGKTTEFLSKKLNTSVKIKDFKLDFFDEISIGNIYIGNKNAPNDTLINVGRLRVDINYTDFLWGITQLDAIKLEDATVRIRRNIGQYDDNFQFVIDSIESMFPKDTSVAQKPEKIPDIRFGQIHLRNIDIRRDDSVQGQVLAIKLKAADIHTNIINLPNHIMDMTRINIFDPYVHVIETVGNPLPPRPHVKSKKTLPSPQSENEKDFQFLIGAISLEKGVFKLDKWDKTSQIVKDSSIDFNHLAVKDINIAIHNFMFTKDEWTGVVDGISLKEKSGFVLNKLTVGDAKVTPTETALYGLQIETPNTIVGDTFRMIYPSGYNAFNNYDNEVTMDGRIHTSKVLINDVMLFSSPLMRNPFFRQNRYANARIEAQFFGKVNSLKVKPFNIGLGNGLVAEGTFESRNLDDVNEAYIKLNLKELKTNTTSLRQLIPDFKPNSDFDKLGALDFKGEFVGFFNNFTANGHLESALGAATMDMTLVPQSDTSEAHYNGNLALDKFNIGELTGLPELGKVSIKTKILRGIGFSKEKLSLDLEASVDNFQYQNYEYRNLSLSGNLTHNQFNGKFESHDPNIDLVFDGSVDFAKDIPTYKFKSDIHHLDFLKLNLLNEDYTLSGRFDLDGSGDKMSNIAGTIDARNLLLIKNKTEQHVIDSLIISSLTNDIGEKAFGIRSEILTADINGNFSLEQIPNAIKAQFYKNHPHLAEDLGLLPKYDPLSTYLPNGHVVGHQKQDFSFKINIFNSKNLTKLFDSKLDTLRNISFYGGFSETEDTCSWMFRTHETHKYADVKIEDLQFFGHSSGIDIDWNIYTSAVRLGTGQDFREATIQNHITADSMEFGLSSPDFSTALSLKKVDLNVALIHQDSSFKLSFGTKLDSRLDIFGDTWDIAHKNFILINKSQVEIEGFEMSHGDREITLHSTGKRGISAFLNNFDIGFLNNEIQDKRFVFGGKYKVYAAVEDVFNIEKFGVTGMIDSLMVNGENRGVFQVVMMGDNLKDPIHAAATLTNDTAKLAIDGFYYPSVSGTHQAKSIDFNLSLASYPFQTLKLLIEEGASGFKGRVDGGVHIEGPLNAINTEGSLRLRDAEVIVDYLKVPIRVKDETVKITNSAFDATGCKVYDKFGNTAIIKGGLTHNRFQDFGMNLRVTSKNFFFLNTTRDDNPLYYGMAIGEGDIKFSGDFNKTDIHIKAKAGKGRDENKKEIITRVTFPFSNQQTAEDRRFVVFKNKYQKTDSSVIQEKNKVKDLSGINLEMELEITPDAEANLIFDEIAGDNIKARGSGDFNIAINRSGAMTMDGEYRIERGDYLFTLLRLVNKNFAIKNGSTIRWNGSPFDAVLNIDAEYKDLSTSPHNFVSEYVNTGDGSDTESRKPTKVGLTLKLTGPMLKPDINFNLGFPQLQGPLKTYTETKLRLLQQDINELNRQVFGLIVVGSFLPSDIGVSQIRSGGINTLTETASNLLSNMLNKLVKEYITGLDIQVGYNYYQYDIADASNPLAASGQQFRLRGSYAFNDRLTLSGGVGIEQGEYVQTVSQNTSNVFVGSDVYLDYDVSEDRRLKLRVSYLRDLEYQGRRDKPAVGIRFRQEFDSLDELLKSITKDAVAKKKEFKRTEIEN